MADKSGIEWTEATWNPVTGCTKVSPGCKHCYAKHQAWPRLAATKGTVYYGRDFEDVMIHPQRLDQPLRWQKPRMIFVNSMSDLFHVSIPTSFIDKIFAVMALARQHTYQVLTKRPTRMLEYLTDPQTVGRVRRLTTRLETEEFVYEDTTKWSWPLGNIWIGVSVEDQRRVAERLPMLAGCSAAVRWLSCEPLLGPINLDLWLNYLHWVVIGGESGKGARPMHPEWAKKIILQCNDADVPVFFKQWGEWSPERPSPYCKISKKRWSHESVTFRPDGSKYDCTEPDTLWVGGMKTMYRVGKKKAGCVIDGQVWDEYPHARS